MGDLREAARMFAGGGSGGGSSTRSSTGRSTGMVLTARGTEQQADGADAVNAWINLALAAGKAGRPYCGYGAITGQGNGQRGREHGQKADQLPGYRKITDPAAREHVAAVWGISPDALPGPGRPAVELLASCGTDIRALLVALVILACGVRPRVGLARSAGLPVDRGILVDTSGRSLGDERIFAIGDCAEAVDRPAGALAALDDARRAAASILGSSPLPAAAAPLRLRTYGVPGADVAVLGRPRAEAAIQFIQFTDQRRRTRKVLALDGDVPVAAALVGDVGAAAALAQAIARPSAPAPRVPAALLTSGAGRGAGGFGSA
ncbi:hypothetical protein ABIA35_004246 [Catenulispora sp. MAP12-49]|uniref:FAD-dependent oxidoreductase n=1 Tax=Catenulispora sp. MAP12-49 TaxID=3156302 RepID=UPI0035157248